MFCLFFITLTIRRNLDWRDPITFYETNLKYTPNSFIQHNNLGMAYANAGRLEEAIKEYKTAISIADIYPQVHYNLGNALIAVNNLTEAETEYYKSIAISPGFSLPYINLIKLAVLTKDEAKLQLVLDKFKANFDEEYYLTQAFYSYYSFGDGARAKKIGQELTQKYPTNSNEVGLLMLSIR